MEKGLIKIFLLAAACVFGVLSVIGITWITTYAWNYSMVGFGLPAATFRDTLIAIVVIKVLLDFIIKAK